MRQKSNYKILGLVARGQFGRVFAAIERKSGTLVALKELKHQGLSTSSFLRELNFLVTLNHFNIVTCKALEHRQGNRYLVMDYCEGGTLRRLLDKSLQPNLLQSLKLVIDILSGLKFAHDRGIIHRDIKPENILLRVGDKSNASLYNWTAHISDFGIAKLQQEANQGVMGNTGSPAYMAPEQFYGQYSYSCDLYAVGVILYELVVGDRPFSGMPKELLSAHLNQPVLIPDRLPFMLRSAIAKSLQKLPHRRFPSAAEMLKSLQLVQTVLTASMVQAPAVTEAGFTVLNSISQTALDSQVSYLAIATEKIYLASEARLYLQQYSDSSLVGKVIEQYALTLDKPVRALDINAPGCFVSTASSVYFIHPDTSSNEFFFVNKTLIPIAVFPTNDLVCGIDPTGSWLAVSYLPSKSKTPAWEIFQLPNCRQKRSQVNRKQFDYLIALDRRRGLGIYQNQQQRNTELHLFDRRGNWLANFTLQILFDLVVHNPLFPHQLLVTEQDNPRMAVLISLEKFKVERIPLNITPHFVTSCTTGYLLSDRYGNTILLNQHGECLNKYQVSLPIASEITAIAVSGSTLLVASASALQSQLQVFSWD